MKRFNEGYMEHLRRAGNIEQNGYLPQRNRLAGGCATAL